MCVCVCVRNTRGVARYKYCVLTGDNLQVNGAAVGAGGVAGSAYVLPRHAFSEVAQPQGAVSLICETTAQLHTQVTHHVFMGSVQEGLEELEIYTRQLHHNSTHSGTILEK